MQSDTINPTDGTTALAVEQFYSVSAVAALLSRSEPFIRGLERAGMLRGIRIGNGLRFAASEINRYLADCANAPRRTPPPELLEAGGRPRKRR